MSKARDLANAGTALTTVSATELGYLDGVTSAVQTQLNAKQATVSGVDSTEIGYLDGVTSAIQTQINARIPASTITTKGDLIVGTGNGTYIRQGVGTNGQLLAANSAQADGVEWVNPPASGSMTLISTTTLSGTNVAITSIPSTYKSLYLVGTDIGTTSSGPAFFLRFNNDSNANYYNGTIRGQDSGISSSGTSSRNEIYFAEGTTRTGRQRTNFTVTIPNYTSTATKIAQTLASWGNEFGAYHWLTINAYDGGSAISQINLLCNGGPSFSGGTILLYGVN